MNKSLLLLFILLSSTVVISQEKKTLNITKTAEAPKIDGVLDDVVWQVAEKAKGFIQYRPEMGIKEDDQFRTVVKVSYDDNAIYVGAYLYDDPSKIMRQISSRDNFGQSDFLMLILNPNNDAQNNTFFVVFSSGTQADAVASSENEDWGWNAVWDSAVKINDDGWVVEMKIPYSALRFSNQEIQTWGMQIHREFRRNRTRYTWNPIDASKGFSGLYHGELKGIENINPPTRLSLYPFISGATTSFDGENETDLSIGLDVKYGLTENFTLDATLIPDFSQTAFDNLTLNLGPFEQTFSEQRQFFKEGVDLFDKGNLFFSRRVGNAPTGEVQLRINEEVTDFPSEVKTLNALKLSGRTKKGLGIGFFNAITEKTEATIKNNVTDETRKEVVEPLANYNILVIDQQLGTSSSVSLINTNVTRSGHFRDANVTGALFDLSNKNNTFNLSGEAKMSNVKLDEGNQSGFSSRLRFAKVSGNYRFEVGHNLADTKYDINDLGLQIRNNFNNLSGNVSYRIFEPTEKLNDFRISLFWDYNRLYNPSTYTGNNIGINVNAQTKKLLWFGGNINASIGKQHDYFEPRTEGRFFTYKNNMGVNGWINTNSNKPFSLQARLNVFTLFDKERDVFFYSLNLEPRFRFSDKFVIGYEFDFNNGSGSRGFVANIGDDIVFGQRDQKTIENSISGNYNFNSFHGLSLTFRHFWTTVTYDDGLFALQEDGSLTTSDGYTVDDVDDPNINFNTWNLDFSYSWEFGPGSFLTALYRNQLFNQNTLSKETYFKSLNTLFDQPIQHTFSLKLVYYIDYNNIKNIFKKKST